MRLRRVSVLVAAAGFPAFIGLAGTVAAAPAGTSPPAIVVENGMTQPIYSAATSTTEVVWVETEVDTDSDGELDRVAVQVDLPADVKGTSTTFATILTASPYLACCRFVENHPVDLPELPQEDLFDVPGGGQVSDSTRARAELARATADAVREQFLADGYAIVTAQTIGTADSDGCPTIGDENEVLSVTAVIQWLTGKRPAYDADGNVVEATWSSGDVGMTGVSYDGTLPEMVATTGIEGLRTIVPISAISSWYDYYRANGLVVAPGTYQGEDEDVLAEFNVSDAQFETCSDEIDQMYLDQDRVTGDYSAFWRHRDYVRRADGIKASVFIVHGLNDWNVKMQHPGQFWAQLSRLDIPRKIWLHQFGHGGPVGDTTYDLPGGGTSTYDDTVNRWMAYWLYGVDNGVMDEPRAIVQREDLSHATYSDWPEPGAEHVRLRLSAPDASAPGSLRTDGMGPHPRQSFVDAGRTRTAEDLASDPDAADGNRLAYVSEPLTADRRLSGRPMVRLVTSVDNRGDANVTALLVDYAPDGTSSIVTRGWMDPQNRVSLHKSRSVVEGRPYVLRFGMQPDDYVFASGHQIGLVVISTDYDYTIRPEPGTALTLGTRHSAMILPLGDAM